MEVDGVAALPAERAPECELDTEKPERQFPVDGCPQWVSRGVRLGTLVPQPFDCPFLLLRSLNRRLPFASEGKTA